MKKIVITGGPSTGKTSIINGLADSGWLCYQEYIRELTTEAKEKGDLKDLNSNPIDLVADSVDFNTKLITGRLAHYNDADAKNKEVVFFDRGIHDVLAYMSYYKQDILPNFHTTCTKNTYDCIFMIPMWRDIFTTDAERFESFDDALKIEQHLRDTYKLYGHKIIDVPFDTVENRISFILSSLK